MIDQRGLCMRLCVGSADTSLENWCSVLDQCCLYFSSLRIMISLSFIRPLFDCLSKTVELDPKILKVFLTGARGILVSLF